MGYGPAFWLSNTYQHQHHPLPCIKQIVYIKLILTDLIKQSQFIKFNFIIFINIFNLNWLSDVVIELKCLASQDSLLYLGCNLSWREARCSSMTRIFVLFPLM